MSKTTQGKCPACRRRYVWPTRTGRLADAACPKCGADLEQTTYTLRWPTITLASVPEGTDESRQRRVQSLKRHALSWGESTKITIAHPNNFEPRTTYNYARHAAHVARQYAKALELWRSEVES